MNEINNALSKSPRPCRYCGYSLPPLKNYRTGELRYPAHHEHVCDRCRDYELSFKPESETPDWGEDSAFYANQR